MAKMLGQLSRIFESYRDCYLVIPYKQWHIHCISQHYWFQCTPSLKMFKTLSHFLLIIKLTIKFFTLILCSLLPPIHIKAISEHQKELHHGRIVCLIHLLRCFTHIDSKEFIAVEHILSWFCHCVYVICYVFKSFYWSFRFGFSFISFEN